MDADPAKPVRYPFDDPVAEAAPIAHALAARHCTVDPATGESCAWYHGGMLYRALLAQDAPFTGPRHSIGWEPSHHAFLAAALGAIAEAGRHPRVLVSGTAEYATPAVVIAAYGQQRARLELAVLDACETPLRVSAWYAARHGIPITTIRARVLDYRSERPFDVITTHHFLNYFGPTALPSLFACWRDLLRPGGQVVLVNSIRPQEDGRPFRMLSPEAIDRMVERLTAEDRWRRAPDLSPAALEVIIRGLARPLASWPVPAVDTISAMMRAAGLRMVRAECLAEPGVAPTGTAEVAGRAGVYGIVAERG